jgi:hypothetical protein
MYWPDMAIAVKDISMPPERRTTKTPIAKIPKLALLFPRSSKFSKDKKEGFKDVTKIE